MGNESITCQSQEPWLRGNSRKAFNQSRFIEDTCRLLLDPLNSSLAFFFGMKYIASTHCLLEAFKIGLAGSSNVLFDWLKPHRNCPLCDLPD